ncbi:ABC transporter substrate-binding protein [Roseomonas sp. E05]|uniref:ABC transporter substrate-binding protein n=1 Tax=Roseomonas sp. E05 TaxID=3046310 RepID=UPI0024BBC075|nr:ABC transporter substrate-binding protein [Roseomonas sp. E05]MDJ0391096.1 ABC transporter substrate-binding protein [Roseomonas sp. E05]
MSTPRRLLLALALSLAAAPAVAQPADPAAAQIEQFHRKLLEVMRQAKSLGIEGRYRELAPAVRQAFDLPAMARLAVGSRWSGFSPAEQAAVAEAFARMSIASYARNFSGFSGQSFVIDRVDAHGDEKVVASRLINPGESPVDLTYRMRNAGDGWKAVDVLHDSISELAMRRSEFSTSVRQGGAALLVQRLNELSDRLMQG